MRRTLVAWSGGKDSALALAALQHDRSVTIVGLVTAVTPEYDRVSIHGTRRSILRSQAERLRLPLFEALIRVGAGNAAYEEAWASAIADARDEHGDITAIAYGDLFLEDVRAYRERQCTALGIEPLFPLWGTPTEHLARRAIRDGYRAYLTCVDTTQLDASFAGRLFDSKLLSDLPASVDPCGERGEFHSCVVSAPTFSGPIDVTLGTRVLRDWRFSYCDLVHNASSAVSASQT
ncbi:MAG: ATP-binding protein [Gemmatimonadaceae bacterium]